MDSFPAGAGFGLFGLLFMLLYIGGVIFVLMVMWRSMRALEAMAQRLGDIARDAAPGRREPPLP